MCRKVIGAVWMITAFFLSEKAVAQQFAFRVSFTDKNNTPYSLSTPAAYLSPRAIARRTTQGIAIDSTDLPVNQTYIDSVLTLTSGIFHGSSRWLNLCVVLLPDSSLIHNLNGKAFVSGTKLVGVYSTALHFKQTGPQLAPNDQSNARKTTSTESDHYGNTWEQTSIVKGNYLHNNGFSGAGKLIAVLDAGFSGTDTHPGYDSLRNSGRITDVRNFALASNNVYGYDDHGTKVLSTMAGYVVNSIPNNYVGSAPFASYALYVTEHGPSEQPIELYNLLFASEHADSIGADIITTSLGYNTFDDPAYNFVFTTDFDGKSTIAAKAANAATKKGMLYIASAGNEGGGPWNNILTPGDADSALTIGSVTSGLIPWITSGYGPNADGQVKPDVCALGHFASVFTASGGYAALDGTSLATPQIAGWAACLWQANPTATPYQLRQAIIRCASHYSTPGAQMGYGVPNFQCTEQLLHVVDTPPPFTSANWLITMPNPFSGEVRIAVSPDSDNNVDFQLMDVTGKTILSFSRYLFKGNNTPITLSLAGLPCGIYLLKAVSPTQQKVVRLEKM